MRRLLIITVFVIHNMYGIAQNGFTKPFWDAYNNAADPVSKREAYQKLEGIYSRYRADTALLISNDYLQYAEKNDKNYTPYIRLRIGAVYTRKLEFEKAKQYILPVLEESERNKNDTVKAAALYTIGNLNRGEKKRELCIQRVSEAADIHQRLGSWKDLAQDYNLLGAIYNPGDTALVYFNKGIELARAYHYPEQEASLLNNIGVNYHYRKQYDKAREYYIMAATIQQTLPAEKHGLCFSLLNIGYVFNFQQQWDEARPWFEKALPVCQECENVEGEGSVYLGLKNIALAKKDYPSALHYQQLEFSIDSLLLTQQYSKANLELETKYNTAQKEKQLLTEKDKRNKLLFAAALLLLLLVTSFIIFRNRQLLRQRQAKLKAEAEHTEAEKLRQLDKIKSSFFANISHEFRTPLTLILSPLKQIEQGKTEPGELKKYLKMMRHNGERLLHLINQLLDLSKLESGKLELQVAKTDITGLLKATVYSFNSLAEQKQVNYHTHFPEQEIIGWIDKDKFQKIITNLLANAFKFTPENGSVSVFVENGDKRIRITIQDSGPGIPKEQLDKIFDRFYQVEGTEGGSGIGLSLVKELVQLHKGQISVSSETGRGASFRLSLPVAREFYSDETILPAGTDSHSETIAYGETTRNGPSDEMITDNTQPVVLVVEDNPDLQSFICDILKNDFNILQAMNGQEGLQKALDQIPDLVVSDLMMPVMDGVTMTNELKQNEKTSHIPIIILTAKAASESKIEGLKTGADDYLVKPFDGDELIVRIRNLVEQRQKLRELFSQKIISITPDKTNLPPLDNSFLENVRNCISDNVDNEFFSVVELASAVNMSRSQLHRKLKALTGSGPNELIRNFRLERALALLQKGAGNVTEIAFMTGFSSPAYFSKCFSERYGYPPADVKKRQ